MTAPRESWILRTFGGLALESCAADGTVTEVQRGGKPLALLAYLCAADGKRVRRAVLADLLWGDESPESARGSLRQALHTLRRLVGEELFDGDRSQLTLRDGIVTADSVRLADASAAGDTQEMLRWYRGPYCEELVLRGASAFDHWVEAERDRLSRLVTAAVQRDVATRTAAGDVVGAAASARALQRAEPTAEGTVVLAADALVAAGAFGEARLALENFRARQLASGETPSEAISSRLAKLRSVMVSRPRDGTERRSPFEIAQRFVGREDIIGELFRARDAAREGQVTRVMLVGPPGIGKSRVLDEFEARMRSRGARMARVRFLPAMREIAGSALAECARALCSLPGAMGISESSAATLVGLLPELRDRFPSAVPSLMVAGDVPRRRAEALADLLAAVAEDRLITVLMDDEHNMDAESRTIVESALRRTDLRLLEVRSARSAAAMPGVRRIAVAPFTVREVHALLEAEGRLPGDAWVDAALEVLTSETQGVPQLLMLRLRELDALGVLRLDGATWRIDSAAELAARVPGAPAVGDVIDSLPATARRTLQVLAHFRRAMPESALLGVLAMVASEHGLAEWRAALAMLEGRGLSMVRDDGWLVAHDTIAEAALAAQSPQEREAVQLAIVRQVAGRGQLTVPMLEHVALLCGATEQKGAALLLVRLASRERGLGTIGVRGRALAKRVANAAGRPEWFDDLYETTGWLSRRSGRGLIAIGSGAGVALVVLLWVGWMLWPRLVVDSAPMADITDVRGNATFAIQPRIKVVNGFGRMLTGYRGAIRVRGVQRPVAGDTIRRPQGGLAQFERLSVLGSESAASDTTQLLLEFTSTRFARSVRVPVAGAWGTMRDMIRPIRIVVNGRELDSTYTATAPSGDSLRVAVTFEYSTVHPTVNYIVAASATWMPRERVIRLAGLPRPVHRAWQTTYFTLPSPPRAGLHHIIILFEPEDSAEHIFALSSWTLGPPQWHDGYDVMDLSPQQIRQLKEKGVLQVMRATGTYSRPQSERVIGEKRVSRDMKPYSVMVLGTINGFVVDVVLETP